MSSTNFRKLVWTHYKKSGRHDLPWRKTRNPYKILVSEMMLQQTQVERVIPYYNSFIKQFPTARRLAAAPLSDVLQAWQGLGYNRRAKLLQLAARAVGHGPFPKHLPDLEKLPGVGPYTARAIMAFAYNQDVVFIETNIRTAVMRHFFVDKRSVSDAQISKVLERVMPRRRGREWNWALMDYGSYLKRSGVKLNAKSKHYSKQSKFTGSLREARGTILRELSRGSQSTQRLITLLGSARRTQLRTAIAALEREGLIEKRSNRHRLSR